MSIKVCGSLVIYVNYTCPVGSLPILFAFRISRHQLTIGVILSKY
jgi:hypothetical protein